ncbi:MULTISPECIES: hypothetical protein [unclassified Spirosoma]|uniref:hypothetical protein n=1 Tax=unclassified Spirosoma TaxID=2621999 RepID=UPI00096925D9|nr:MULTISPECIES: hypothetical protein [unclassified Spirosoma]MBN8822966.1 hypothetical protein [Spirosoma sp.]OJW73073.1 MAG: hypothetical protein BGO59_06135 [Spirosoma sp. 48-14]
MKRYVYHLYVVCLVVSFVGLVSCSKSDPAPASPVVGRWTLNKGVLSGFPTSATSNVNGAGIDLYYFESYGSTIDIFSDNTFNENYRSAVVDDATGTWDFSSNTLTLKYDAGGQDTYTYAKNKNIEELTITTPAPYTLGTAVGKVQLVYRK